jgi:hypothetical protein
MGLSFTIAAGPRLTRVSSYARMLYSSLFHRHTLSASATIEWMHSFSSFTLLACRSVEGLPENHVVLLYHKGKFVHGLNKLSDRLWRLTGERKCSSTVLDLRTRWRWVVSFMPRPLHSRGNEPQYPLDTRLGGLQGRSESWGVQKNSCSCWNRTPAVKPLPLRYTALLCHISDYYYFFIIIIAIFPVTGV